MERDAGGRITDERQLHYRMSSSEVKIMSFNVTISELLGGKMDVSRMSSDIYRIANEAEGNPTFGIDLDFSELRLSEALKATTVHQLIREIEDTLSNWRKRALNVMSSAMISKITIPNLLDGEVNISELYLLYNAEGNSARLGIDLDFPALRLSETLESSELYRTIENRLYLLYRTIEDTLSNWEKKYQRHLDTQHREHRSTSVDDMNRGAREAIETLHSILVHALDIRGDGENRLENSALEEIKSHYKTAEPKATEEYYNSVLTGSNYPDYFPRNWHLEYRADARMVVVDYDLPSPDQLPTVESYRYIKARDEIVEKPLTEAARKKLYDSVIYQVCIRTLHELFEADTTGAVETVAFNGLVTSTNPATGIKETKTIISVSAAKDEFMAFDLSKVEPKATFRHLKGVAAATLVNLTPIPPVIKLNKTDKRFVENKEIALNLDGSVNIAAMHWEDFEHLVRELFEKEFTSTGGEVKVTQASADGGVDAVAFDPDPIRGGKIVIQAKRYTNTVGVAAVRDLYGTVMNEGAIKGILVTTSDYGKDSYEFAKDKPLTLLNGSNLLALLEKHGHQARIDVTEAKKILNV